MPVYVLTQGYGETENGKNLAAKEENHKTCRAREKGGS